MSDMSDSSQQPPQAAQTASASAGPDDIRAQYERACAEMRGIGEKLNRQMHEYQAVLEEIARLEASDTPQADETLRRLESLVQSEAFRRDEREIRRMSAALAHSLERMMADAPLASADATTSSPVKRSVGVRRTCA
jgi:multidrug resistance efflux pump